MEYHVCEFFVGWSNDCTQEMSSAILLSIPVMCSETEHTSDVC